MKFTLHKISVFLEIPAFHIHEQPCIKCTYLPGRAVRCLPAPPQIRTSGLPASGSSVVSFAMKIQKSER